MAEKLGACIEPGAPMSPGVIPDPGAAARPAFTPEEPGAEPSPGKLGSVTSPASADISTSERLALFAFSFFALLTLGFFTSFEIESILDASEGLFEMRETFD